MSYKKSIGRSLFGLGIVFALNPNWVVSIIGFVLIGAGAAIGWD